MQSRGNGVRRGTKTQFPESTKTVRGHDLLLGSMLFLNKTAPSPRFRINPYLNLDIDTGKILIGEEDEKTALRLDQMLEGKSAGNEVLILDADGDVYYATGQEVDPDTIDSMVADEDE